MLTLSSVVKWPLSIRLPVFSIATPASLYITPVVSLASLYPSATAVMVFVAVSRGLVTRFTVSASTVNPPWRPPSFVLYCDIVTSLLRLLYFSGSPVEDSSRIIILPSPIVAKFVCLLSVNPYVPFALPVTLSDPKPLAFTPPPRFVEVSLSFMWLYSKLPVSRVRSPVVDAITAPVNQYPARFP